MNAVNYTHLLRNPELLSEAQAKELELILVEFPYFQSALALRLKALYSQHSFRYNLELKKTAAQTTDRSVLFDFITSERFKQFKSKVGADALVDVHELEVEAEIITAAPQPVRDLAEDKITSSILSSINLSGVDQVRFDVDFQKVESSEVENTLADSQETTILEPERQEVEIGKPLEFTSSDTYSFQEWLQLTKIQPIVRDREISVAKMQVQSVEKQENPQPEQEVTLAPEKRKKLELIDKFIEANPKIVPDKNAPVTTVLESQNQDNSSLMTETLARVYLEQKKYQKAIEAYEILILKYPEKSVFFADRIENVKKLQQNNN